MQFLVMYMRPQFQTVHAKSVWWEVDAHLIFSLFLFSEKYPKCNFFLNLHRCKLSLAASSCAEHASDKLPPVSLLVDSTVRDLV